MNRMIKFLAIFTIAVYAQDRIREAVRFHQDYLAAADIAKKQIGPSYKDEMRVALSSIRSNLEEVNIDHVSKLIVDHVTLQVVTKSEQALATAATSISEAEEQLTTLRITELVSAAVSEWQRSVDLCEKLTREDLGCPVESDSRFIELANAVAARGEPGMALVPQGKIAVLQYPSKFDASVCNSAPYPLQALFSDASVKIYYQAMVNPGECITRMNIPEESYVAAIPKTGDPALYQIERDSGKRASTLATEDVQKLTACNSNGEFSIASGDCTDLVEFLLANYRETSVIRDGFYPVSSVTVEYIDEFTALKMDRTTFQDTSQRRGYARALNGSLRNRWSVAAGTLMLDVVFCPDDDPYALGITVCGTIDGPHGTSPIAYPNERITAVLDVPVFSETDVNRILAVFQQKASVRQVLRVTIEEEYIREGLAMFTASAYQECPFDEVWAGGLSFIRSLTLTVGDHAYCVDKNQSVYEKCLDDLYTDATIRAQFCPDADSIGGFLGMFGSIGGIVFKGLVKIGVRGAARQTILAAMASSIGVGLINASDELVYAFMTQPLVDANTPFVEYATPYAIQGFVLGVISNRVLR